jgi:hypothetical protein
MLAELIVVFIALAVIGLSLYYLITLPKAETPRKPAKTEEPASAGARGTASTPADVSPPAEPAPFSPAWHAAGAARLRAQEVAELAALPPCIEISRADYTSAVESGNRTEVARMDGERNNCAKRKRLGGS